MRAAARAVGCRAAAVSEKKSRASPAHDEACGDRRSPGVQPTRALRDVRAMSMTPCTPRDTLLRHLAELRRWCVRRSGDPDLADDVIQDTAVDALRRLDGLRDPQRMRGWLFRIMQRRLADASRARTAELPLMIDPEAPAPRSPPDPHTLRLIRRALKRLPACLRRPVRLHYLQGRSLREVALSLDTTVNGVKARLYRARRILRAATRRGRGG
jgi:RNA polymerase sigma-70 factor (ECF subfamily)